MNKYNHSFRKTKSELTKDILKWLAVGGMVCIATTSPFFIINIVKGFEKSQKYKKKKVYDTFYRLRQRGDIKVTEKNNQIYISLTKKGKKKAGRLNIDSIEIKKPKKWDGKWRIIIFDIVELKKLYREVFRGKLKELGFCQLQKSTWIYPYDCCKEIKLLREFFGLSEDEVRLIIAQNIGKDDVLKKYFELK